MRSFFRTNRFLRFLATQCFGPSFANLWMARKVQESRTQSFFKPQAQPLEERLCFSAVTWSISQSTVTIQGSSSADQISLIGGNTIQVVTADETIDTGIDPQALTRLRVFGNAGDDHIEIDPTLGHVSAFLYGGEGNDTLISAGGADFLYGQNGDDLLRGGSGNDLLVGGNGNDLLVGGNGADSLYGEDGNDTIQLDASDLVFDGGAGRDIAHARSAPAGVAIDMAAGSFEIAYGSEFDDVITAVGLPERAIIYGYGGNDTLTGSDCNDIIVGHDGEDIIRGGEGNDSIAGNAGADSLSGEEGDDTIKLDVSDLVVSGGAGRDIADARSAPSGVTIDMAAGSFEIAYGSNFDDVITAVGLAGRVVMHGLAGNDQFSVMPNTDGQRIDVFGGTGSPEQDVLTIVEPIGETTTIATAANGRLVATTTGGFGSIVASNIASTNVVPSPQPEISLAFGRVQTGFTEVQDGDVYFAPSIYGQFASTFEPFHITNTGDSPLVIYEVSAVGDFSVQVDAKGQFEDDEPQPLFPYTIQPGSRMLLRLIPTSPINGIGESQLVIRSNDSDEGEFNLTVQGRFFNGATAGVGFEDQVIRQSVDEPVVLDRLNVGEESEVFYQIINFGSRELVVNELRLPENVTAYMRKRFDDEEGGLTPRIPFTTPAVVGIDRTLELTLVFDTSVAGTIGGEIVLVTNDNETPELAIPILANVSLRAPVELRDDTTNVRIEHQSTQQIPPAVVGERNGRIFRISNSADTPIVLTGLEIDGPFEALVKGTFEDDELDGIREVIQPGQSKFMRVNAVPTEVGPITGNLILRFENTDATFQMALQSSVLEALAFEVTDSLGNLALPLSVNSDGLNVGSTRPGVPLTLTFTLTNTSATSLLLDEAPIVTGSFVLATNFSSLIVLPESSVSFSVTMLSDTVGIKYGSITIQTLNGNEEPSQSLQFAIGGSVFSKGNFED